MGRPRKRQEEWVPISAKISPDSRIRLEFAQYLAKESFGGIIDGLIQAYCPLPDKNLPDPEWTWPPVKAHPPTAPTALAIPTPAPLEAEVHPLKVEASVSLPTDPPQDNPVEAPVVADRPLPPPRAASFPPMPEGRLDPDWVKRTMKELKITQQNIADLVGISRRGVGEWFESQKIPTKHKEKIYKFFQERKKGYRKF